MRRVWSDHEDARLRDQPDISPHEFAYLLLESGIPTIVVFATKRETKAEMHHMFPVVGHTMNRTYGSLGPSTAIPSCRSYA